MPSLELTGDRSTRFAVLLLAIIAELMLAPLFGESEVGIGVARVMTGLVLVAALSAAGVRPATLLLFVPAIVVHFTEYWLGAPMRVVAPTLRALSFG